MHTAIDVIRRLHAHRRWFREKMIAATRLLTPEQQRAHFAMGPGGVFALLAHCCAAERLWLAMVEGGDPTTPFSPLDENATIEALVAQWSDAEARWERFLAAVTVADLARPITRVREGKAYTSSLGDVLLHVCTHQMYHAAQFKNMLRQLGVTDQPMSDYIVYAREIWSDSGTEKARGH